MARLILYDNSGVVVIKCTATQRGEVSTFRNLKGFIGTKTGIADLEIESPIRFNMKNWQKSYDWKDLGKGALPRSTRHSFTVPQGGGKWLTEISESADKKAHFVEVTGPGGRKHFIVSYENIPPIWIAVGIAAVICLAETLLSAWLTDCTKECGKPPKKIKVGCHFSDDFPYLPECGKECIC